MLLKRVIPVLLIQHERLVKTIGFEKPVYVGDPVNTVKIFNEKEVDELIIADIDASVRGTKPNLALISSIAGECFMPMAYGGGIRTTEEAHQIFDCGVEKISLNTQAFEQPTLLHSIASIYGSQSVIVSMDVRKNFFGKYQVYIQGGRKNTHLNPVDYAKRAMDNGAGEILLNSVERDGTGKGYDVDLIHSVTSSVAIPVIACGGAGKTSDFAAAIKSGASAAAAGSVFFFQGKHRAVLISFPSQQELKDTFAGIMD